MRVHSFISAGERKSLLAVALAAFIFSVAGAVVYSVKEEIKRSAYYQEQAEKEEHGEFVFSGPYCTPDRHPQFLRSIVLFVGAIPLSIYFARKYLLSFFITIAALTRFAVWFIDSRNQFPNDVSDLIQGVDRVLHKAGALDLLALVLVMALLFWQSSILWRMLIKTTPRKIDLP